MNNYIYILVMALTTYLIRMIPLIIFKDEIKNKFIKSFLYYVPYACLMAMTFPSIFHSTSSVLSAVSATIIAITLALNNKSMLIVAVASCITVLIIELFI